MPGKLCQQSQPQSRTAKNSKYLNVASKLDQKENQFDTLTKGYSVIVLLNRGHTEVDPDADPDERTDHRNHDDDQP